MLKSTQNILFNAEYFHNYFKEPTFDTQFILPFLYLHQLPSLLFIFKIDTPSAIHYTSAGNTMCLNVMQIIRYPANVRISDRGDAGEGQLR